MKLIKSLIKYIKLFIRQILGIFSAIFLIIDIPDRILGITINSHLETYISYFLYFSIFLTGFLIWKKEQRDQIECNILESYTAKIPEGVHVTLLLSLTNPGKPIAIEGWRFELGLRKRKKTFRPTAFNPNFTLVTTTEQKTVIQPDEAIYEKTIPSICAGCTVRGWIRFILNGIEMEKFISVKEKKYLVFTDSAKKDHKIKFSIDSKNQSDPLYFAGIKSQSK